MVVDTESAVRHQTLNHFIHTFIRDYDREMATERTMRSRYVPKNIKSQLLAAVRECGNGREASVRICSIADMGLFIDTSCNEIVYYHSITSSVLQWTLSLYVREPHVKNIIKTVLEDMGRIGDEDIQFMLAKYRFNEEQKSVGNWSDETGADRMLSFLKPKKIQPSVSYFSYYAQSMMLKLARSLLRNSVMFLNSDVFNIGSTVADRFGRSGGDERRTDTESARLYEDYRNHAKNMAAKGECESLEKMRRVLRERTANDEGIMMREPPEEVITAYDQPLCSEEEEDCGTETEDDVRERGGRDSDVPRGTFSAVDAAGTPAYRTSPPHSREDLEVETIMKRVTDSDTREWEPSSMRTKNGGPSATIAVRPDEYVTDVVRGGSIGLGGHGGAQLRLRRQCARRVSAITENGLVEDSAEGIMETNDSGPFRRHPFPVPPYVSPDRLT